MLSAKMQEALNQQMNAELYSAYLYLSMAAYFASNNLPGATNWMECQAQEELTHATKFYRFINERGGRVLLTAVEGPPTEWDSPLAVFEAVLAHEQKVTGLINDLVFLARDERDNASEIFLQWFVSEQVEEEASADEVLQKLKLAGEHPGGLFMVDNELAARTFVYPPATAE